MIFRTDIKIRGYHLDVYGHVNNARWVELLEEARWRWLDQDMDLKAWDDVGQGIAVIHLNVTYRRPAHMHDLLEFQCWITRLGGRNAVCHQEVWRKGTDEKLVEADVSFVLIDTAVGRPRPMTGPVRDAFLKYQEREDDA